MLECLQRALRVADSCMETATSIELFVEILDRYVYYFDQGNESVSQLPQARYLPPLLPSCRTPFDEANRKTGDD